MYKNINNYYSVNIKGSRAEGNISRDWKDIMCAAIGSLTAVAHTMRQDGRESTKNLSENGTKSL